jgi:hypothetical protein
MVRTWQYAMALIAVVASATVVDAACPAYPPEVPENNAMTYRGMVTGCPGNPPNGYIECRIGGEPMQLTLVPSQGRPIQSCDVIEWDFGDGQQATTTGATPVIHDFVVPSWRASFFPVTAKITNALGTATARGGASFPTPPCTRGNRADASSMRPNFTGPLTGCTPLVGQCAVGERVSFTISLSEPKADPCNSWYADWGDGTPHEGLPIDGPTADATAAHYFATAGTFNVTFLLISSLPGPSSALAANGAQATLLVKVTADGKPEKTKRRAARH